MMNTLKEHAITHGMKNLIRSTARWVMCSFNKTYPSRAVVFFCAKTKGVILVDEEST